MNNPDAMHRVERIEQAGRPVPESLMPPVILPGYEEWLVAFNELGTDRHLGQGIGPIPAASIDRHTAGWPQGEAALFRRCIRAMDAEFLPRANGVEPQDDDSDNPARDAFRARMR